MTYYAFDYLAGLISHLASHADSLKIITYRDLHWQEDRSLATGYVAEHEAWKASRAGSAANPSRPAEVLIQYDIDQDSPIAMRLVRLHIALGIPANLMIFRRCISQERLQATGEVCFLDYPLDIPLLKKFHAMGGCIGYHSNAYEVARFDPAKALEIFEEDVTELRKNFRIDYFSPHGGARDPEGRSNAFLPIDDAFLQRLDLRWVHNRYAPSFTDSFSDGGIHQRLLKDATTGLDLPRFLHSFRQDGRYRILLHPQYYAALSESDVAPLPASSAADIQISINASLLAPAAAGLRSRLAAGSQRDLPLARRAQRLLWPTCHLDFWRQVGVPRHGVMPAPSLVRTERPIFVHGLSRSGTTLLTAILDAHRKVSMSYELYPEMLEPPKDELGSPSPSYSDRIRSLLQELPLLRPDGIKRRLAQEPASPFKTFLQRIPRGGLGYSEAAGFLIDFLDSGGNFDSPAQRLAAVAALCRFKMRREAKTFWGAKSSSNHEAYWDIWPKARILFTLRDPRDIFASQLNNGNFNPNPTELATSWVRQYESFLPYTKDEQRVAHICQYESFVATPEAAIERLCDALDLPHEPAMVDFHSRDSSLLRNPQGHLSAARVASPIDSASVGRWKQDLDSTQARAIVDVAGDLMSTLGYL